MANKKPEVYMIAEEMPQFPGGDMEMLGYVFRNLRYPEVARAEKIEGAVLVRFIVNEDGSIGDVRIMNDIGGGCGEEAKRLIESMPNLIPGKHRGVTVKTYFTFSVKFNLDRFESNKARAEKLNASNSISAADTKSELDIRPKPEPSNESAELEEQLPTFPGGDEALMKFVSANIRYPALARENNVQGRVILKFIVDVDGSVGNVRVLRDIGQGCGKEAARVMRTSPKWNPAIRNGEKSRAYMTVPVEFKLEERWRLFKRNKKGNKP